MLSTSILLPIVLLLSQSSSVAARICYNNRGQRYYCNGLANPARIGIGIAAAVVFALLLTLCLFGRRRRASRANLVYAQQQQAEMGQAGNPQYGNFNYQQNYQNGNGQQQQQFQPPPQQSNQGQAQGGFANFFRSNQNNDDVQAPPPSYSGNGSKFSPPSGPPPSELTSEQREQQQHEEDMRLQNGGAGQHYAPPADAPPK